jgi:hypothetical protein
VQTLLSLQSLFFAQQTVPEQQNPLLHELTHSLSVVQASPSFFFAKHAPPLVSQKNPSWHSLSFVQEAKQPSPAELQRKPPGHRDVLPPTAQPPAPSHFSALVSVAPEQVGLVQSVPASALESTHPLRVQVDSKHGSLVEQLVTLPPPVQLPLLQNFGPVNTFPSQVVAAHTLLFSL